MPKKSRSRKKSAPSVIGLNSVPAGGLVKGKLLAIKPILKKHFKAAAAGNPFHAPLPKLPAMKRAMQQFIEKLGGHKKILKAHNALAAGNTPDKADLANIVGVFIGKKYTGNGVAPGPCIRFHVRKKFDNLSDVDPATHIPPFIKIGKETFPTDVVETGPVRALQAIGPQNPANGAQKPARIPCGSSVSDLDFKETGTIGALCVVDETVDGKAVICILTNNHVTAGVNTGTTYVDDPDNASKTVHAGIADTVRLRVDPNTVALLYRFGEISFSEPNEVDAALSFANTDWLSSSHENFTIDPSPMEPAQNMTVKKEGRTTYYTEGIIDVAYGSTTATYQVNGQDRVAWFENQMTIRSLTGRPFSLEGDSGSLVCELNSSRPVGLLFAGDGVYTYATPISSVMTALNVSKFLPDPDIFDQ